MSAVLSAEADEFRSERAFIEARIRRGRAGMFTEVVEMTPRIAQLLVNEYNPRNRRVALPLVKKYADLMRQGRWLLVSQGVSLCDDGLNNGQHRLMGCVASGVTVPINMTFGESSEAFFVLDRARTRTGGDVLLGEKYANNIAGTIKLLRNIKDGSPRRTEGLENDYISRIFANRPEELREASYQGTRLALKNACSGVGAAAAYFLIAEKPTLPPAMPSNWQAAHATKLAEFWERMCDGQNLAERNPILTLRSKFFNARFGPKRDRHLRTGYLPCDAAAFVVLTWNAWVRDRHPNGFAWQEDDFPAPIMVWERT